MESFFKQLPQFQPQKIICIYDYGLILIFSLVKQVKHNTGDATYLYFEIDE